MKRNEREIIRGCQRKDPHYERLLVENYAGVLMTVSRRYSRTHQEAEDVLQDAFIKILENIDQFDDGRGSLSGWMRAIVIRTALRDYRKKYPQAEDMDAISEPLQNTYPDIIEKLKVEDLLRTLAELPEGYRQVFNLYVIDGYSHQEIGKLLGIRESTSRSQLTRAKAILKKKLTNDQNQYICTTTGLARTLGLN